MSGMILSFWEDLYFWHTFGGLKIKMLIYRRLSSIRISMNLYFSVYNLYSIPFLVYAAVLDKVTVIYLNPCNDAGFSWLCI